VVTGTSEVPGSAVRRILTPRGQLGTVGDSTRQLANNNRYVKKLSTKAEATQIEVLPTAAFRMGARPCR
jgi:hypothetical protein